MHSHDSDRIFEYFIFIESFHDECPRGCVASYHEDLHKVASTIDSAQVTSLEISGIFSSIPFQHFSDATTPSSIHLTECIQHGNLYVVINMTWRLHKYRPRPTLCLTARRTFQSNSWFWRRCCARTLSFLLKSYCLPQFVRLFFTCWLWSSFTNVDDSQSLFFVLVIHDVTARCVRVSNRHLLIVFITGFHGHIPCTSLYLSSSPLSDSLSLSDSVLVCIHPGFSRQASLNNHSDSLSESILTWFCRFSMQSKQRMSPTTSHVLTDTSVLNLQKPQHSRQSNILSFFILDELLQFCSRDHRFPGIEWRLSYPTFASHNSIVGNIFKWSGLIVASNKHPLNYAFHKWFNVFSKLRWCSRLSPSSTRCQFVQELHCEMRDPFEQRNVFGDSHACVPLTRNSESAAFVSSFLCCICKSDLEMCMRSPAPRTRNQQILMMTLFVFCLSPTLQVESSQHNDLWHK